MISRLVFSAVAALATTCAFAQAPVMFPWWDSPIARDLGLTEDQNRQIRATVDESRGRLSELRSAVETAERELRSELNASQVDTRRANDAIERIVAARSDLTRAVSQMSLKLRLVLSPDQWQELQKREPRGRRGPGFGPPPGGHGERGGMRPPPYRP
jgi:Spy/CpxP family protein refolding chaperone